MKFKEFEHIISPERMGRYVQAMEGDTRKAMTLYRLNLKLSQEFFTVVSCLEISLRNAIDRHYTTIHGTDWLRDSILSKGFYNRRNCGKTPYIIGRALRRLKKYSHSKLLAEMDFGFWRYAFGRHQYRAAGQSLLDVFPNKPLSTSDIQYNNTYVFGKLEKINMLRNRLAHHEPICFANAHLQKDTSYIRKNYGVILEIFDWMNIEEQALLYGLDHIESYADRIDKL